MIKFTPRLYQETIFNTCSLQNTLVVLPTGLGKTNVFVMVASKRLSQYPSLKIMLLGPTRPLIEQYFTAFKENLEIDEEDMAVITGQIKAEKRIELYKNKKIIFSTPQCIENDIITSKIELKEFSLIGFDEAHRAAGDYAYNFIAKKYHEDAQYERIVAMTASPGADKEKINEVMKNLYIEAIEVKTEEDPDVKPYIQQTKIKTIEVELPEEFRVVKKYFDQIINDKSQLLKEFGIIKENIKSKTDVLLLQREIQSKLSSGEKDFESLKAMSVLAEIIKVQHGVELIESQGAAQLLDYMKKTYDDSSKTKTKAVISLAQNPYFLQAYHKVKEIVEKDIKHPKFDELARILLNHPEGKKIIFTQFRDTAIAIKNHLNMITCEIFVGQAKKNGEGISQKKQKELIERFREDEFEVLIATSVAEEGLDIPKVDMVIFFEPIPSAIRQIQRRGRTGRHGEGSVIMLVAKGTKDETYKWSAHHKENRMYKILNELKKEKKIIQPVNTTLESFDKQETGKEILDVTVVVDHREKANKIIKQLMEFGIKIKLEQLDIGDYLLSERVCVEFKTVADFVDSIIDGRLLNQLKNLIKYEKPLLIVEGDQDIYNQRNINPSAVRGMIMTAMINFRVPIYFTKNAIESAEVMKLIAMKEQLGEKRGFTMHHSKPDTLRGMQEYIVSSLPGVGSTLSKPLLKRFKTISNIVAASEKDLKEIDLIGEKKARQIRNVLDFEYTEY